MRAKPVPTVFVSSTAEDLKKFRAAARDAAVAAHFLPDMQEYFAARDHPPLAECLERVGGADVLVVVLAHRYGWVPPDQPPHQADSACKSITWLETEHAAAEGKEILAFIVDDAADWEEESKEEYELVVAVREGRLQSVAVTVQRNVEQLRRFKDWLRQRGIRATFVNPEDLQGKVYQALREWRDRHPQFGEAIQPDSAAEPDPARYLEALREDSAYIEIRGLQAAEGKAHKFPIRDLYIPLINEAAPVPSEPTGVAAAIEAREREPVPLEEALRGRRLVIVGDPGAGKSTFLRRIAYSVAGKLLGIEQTIAEPLAGDAPPFPILVRVAELSGLPTGPADTAAPLLDLLAKRGLDYGLPERFLRRRIEEGPCLLLLDGLDEAASEEARETVARLVERASGAWRNCRFVVTTRPQAYREEAVLKGFDEARIGPLDPAAVRIFLTRWCEALSPESPRKAEEHARELIQAVESKPEIWRMARNPVMLTAVAVLHWNEKRMPEQRADLYDSILGWLSRSRKRRAGRPSPERCLALLQELAWEMQASPGGRLAQAKRDWAVEVLAPRFRELASEEEQGQAARAFLEEEELDSGIVVRRGADVRFWHLTFQEHLAAKALAAMDPAARHRLLFENGTAYLQEWREVVLLLAGLLHRERVENADALVSAALDALYRGPGWARVRRWFADPPFSEQVRCAILVGAILRDLQPLAYHPSDARCDAVVRSVLGIFDAERSRQIPFQERLQAAEALGQTGDPRLKRENWVAIPAGTFVMGPGAYSRKVELNGFQIGRYPATVEEYQRFIQDGGYRNENFWKNGGLGQVDQPSEWKEQLLHPNRPVVGVNWYEASAYCAWKGGRLPAEEEWERAARGMEGRVYPWGNDPPDPSRANYHEAKVGAPTPVGLFPRGATPEGIQDLAGNVWEWTSSDYDADRTVVRGGSWYFNATYVRASFRDRFEPGNRYDDLGFRCVGELR
ncbi:MAG TPA: SUMF1/EgtB/PvdO family nonheme iron enzyme [Bryobacteraceae bacterium]